MRVLNTITAYPPSVGGAQIYQHTLNQFLVNQHSIQVISHWDNNRSDWLRGTTVFAPKVDLDYQLDNINVHRLGISANEKLEMLPHALTYYFNIGFNADKIAKILQNKIEEYAQESQLIHNIRVGREGLSYASYYAAKKYKIPFVFTPLHHPRWKGWRYQKYIELYQKADAVIALTNAEKDILISLGVTPEKIIVVGFSPVLANKPNPTKFLEQYRIKKPYVLFLGQHYVYKGYQALLEATKLVWRQYSDLEFVFIGPSVKNSERIFQQFVDPRIHRLGKVDLQTKTDALAACKLLCVPSTQESFGGIYTEAWSFGKPVIGCDIPAVRDVISHGENGLLVNQNPAEIANAICSLLQDSSLPEIMGKRGFHKVQTEYKLSTLANRVSDLYESLIG